MVRGLSVEGGVGRGLGLVAIIFDAAAIADCIQSSFSIPFLCLRGVGAWEVV